MKRKTLQWLCGICGSTALVMTYKILDTQEEIYQQFFSALAIFNLLILIKLFSILTEKKYEN